MKHALTLSIVIPVYNEERYIKRCLEAIKNQTVPPLEVIVVDNNCTDNTVEIAKQYSFVKILREPVQGRTAARNRGFNAARGDIIGRVDADSQLMPNWAETAIKDFSENGIEGLTGPAKTKVILGSDKLYSTFWSRIYFWTTHSYYRAMTMWGANMAIKKSSWLQIRSQTAPESQEAHEDQDLSFVLIGHGGQIMQDNKLLIETAGREYLYWPKFWLYLKIAVAMKKYHQRRGTLDNAQQLRLGFWSILPGAIAGWFFTGVFVIYSLISWPVFAIILHHREKAVITKRSESY